jgi:hypothetical protein
MSRFSGEHRLVQAIRDGVAEMHRTHGNRGWYDGHDLVNWMNGNRNAELNDIFDCYRSAADPVHTGTVQIGNFLKNCLAQRKIREHDSGGESRYEVEGTAMDAAMFQFGRSYRLSTSLCSYGLCQRAAPEEARGDIRQDMNICSLTCSGAVPVDAGGFRCHYILTLIFDTRQVPTGRERGWLFVHERRLAITPGNDAWQS